MGTVLKNSLGQMLNLILGDPLVVQLERIRFILHGAISVIVEVAIAFELYLACPIEFLNLCVTQRRSIGLCDDLLCLRLFLPEKLAEHDY